MNSGPLKEWQAVDLRAMALGSYFVCIVICKRSGKACSQKVNFYFLCICFKQCDMKAKLAFNFL